MAGRRSAVRSKAGCRYTAGLARSGFYPLSSAPMTALSIVVPCFNEEACLAALYERLTEAARKTARNDYEIVLVNDGSRDSSWTIMQRFAAKDPRLVAINLSRNHGHQ